MTIIISHSHFVHVALVSILVFQTFVIEWYLVDWVFLEQGGIHAVTVREPQMVRDQKKFGNHWSTLFRIYSGWVYFLLSSLLYCSVANSSYNEYAKSNLKIYQTYIKFISVTKTYNSMLFLQCLFLVSRRWLTVALCSAAIEMWQAHFLLS